MAYRQAYQQSDKPIGRWTSIMMAYKRHSGSWAWILHRGTGVALTAYLFMHIYALTSIAKGKVEFEKEMQLFSSLPFTILEFLLFIPVVYHSLNGLRIVLVDLGKGARNHKAMLRIIYGVAGIATVVMAWLILGHWLTTGK